MFSFLHEATRKTRCILDFSPRHMLYYRAFGRSLYLLANRDVTIFGPLIPSTIILAPALRHLCIEIYHTGRQFKSLLRAPSSYIGNKHLEPHDICIPAPAPQSSNRAQWQLPPFISLTKRHPPFFYTYVRCGSKNFGVNPR